MQHAFLLKTDAMVLAVGSLDPLAGIFPLLPGFQEDRITNRAITRTRVYDGTVVLLEASCGCPWARVTAYVPAWLARKRSRERTIRGQKCVPMVVPRTDVVHLEEGEQELLVATSEKRAYMAICAAFPGIRNVPGASVRAGEFHVDLAKFHESR